MYKTEHIRPFKGRITADLAGKGHLQLLKDKKWVIRELNKRIINQIGINIVQLKEGIELHKELPKYGIRVAKILTPAEYEQENGELIYGQPVEFIDGIPLVNLFYFEKAKDIEDIENLIELVISEYKKLIIYLESKFEKKQRFLNDLLIKQYVLNKQGQLVLVDTDPFIDEATKVNICKSIQLIIDEIDNIIKVLDELHLQKSIEEFNEFKKELKLKLNNI